MSFAILCGLTYYEIFFVELVAFNRAGKYVKSKNEDSDLC